MTTRIELVQHNSRLYHDTVDLRDRILRKPLGLTFDPHQLQEESDSIHVACFVDDTLTGCLILQPNDEQYLRMRQVAVSDKHQGLGIGRLMVEFSEKLALEHGYRKIQLHARETAVPFYLKLGYEIEGEPFEEVSIPHRAMFKNIDFFRHGPQNSSTDIG